MGFKGFLGDEEKKISMVQGVTIRNQRSLFSGPSTLTLLSFVALESFNLGTDAFTRKLTYTYYASSRILPSLNGVRAC